MPSCHPLTSGFQKRGVPVAWQGAQQRDVRSEGLQVPDGEDRDMRSGSWDWHSRLTYASWIVSPGVHSEFQGRVTMRRGYTLPFQARRVSSQDWGHKDATKVLALHKFVPLGLAG